jgi:flagellar biosynthesis/type III secretory pathway protein FliH
MSPERGTPGTNLKKETQ